MATQAEQAAASAAVWVDQASQQLANLTSVAAEQAAALWGGFTDWYTPDAITERAAAAADLSTQAQQAVVGLMAEYVAQMTALLRDSQSIPVPHVGGPVIRGGVDLADVHARTAKAYRLDFAQTHDVDAAVQAAFDREMGLIEADLMLAARAAQDEAMRGLDVAHYRRVLRPEMSKSGSCGLCIAASLQVYTVDELMPIHDHCQCLTAPILDGLDPAQTLNEQDRQAIYQSLDDRGRADLAKIRVQVRDHGEYGPVLTVRGQKFTGPKDLSKPAAA